MNYDQDIELRNKRAGILAEIPEPSLGLRAEDSKIDHKVNIYAPAAKIGRILNRNNAENSALYRIFLFGLSGIGSSDYYLACRTYDQRICSLGNGWSMDAIWAARLGLAEEACEFLAQHAERYNRFRYGGWDSNDSSVFPDVFRLSHLWTPVVLAHLLLMRFCFRVIMVLSGLFLMSPKAGPGYLNCASRADSLLLPISRVRMYDLSKSKSLSGKECVIENPCKGKITVMEGEEALLQSDAELIKFKTQSGHVYIIELSLSQIMSLYLDMILARLRIILINHSECPDAFGKSI